MSAWRRSALPALHITQARALQQPDNTSTNKQQAPTADQQKETAEDRELAQKIRKSIVDDKSLSTYGHNVKVIVRNGMVTLKGPVQSEDEKKNIGAKAAEVAGGADKGSKRSDCEVVIGNVESVGHLVI